MPNDKGIEYSDEDIIEFEVIFGAGFLSPGGQEEVAKIVENVNLAGKEVLDIGVGIGGPACLLVEIHGAARVTASLKSPHHGPTMAVQRPSRLRTFRTTPGRKMG